MDKAIVSEQQKFLCLFTRTTHQVGGSTSNSQHIELRRSLYTGHFPGARLHSRGARHVIPYSQIFSMKHSIMCQSTGTDVKECTMESENCADVSRDQHEVSKPSGYAPHKYSESGQRIPGRHACYSTRGLAEACKFVHNDAKFVNERARNDIILLSRGITRLNDRARRDVAVLGLGFLKLDARAREDTEKIDLGVKRRAAHLHHIATILKDKAQSDLKRAADKHWSDGALEADLKRADFVVRRRAMEDAYMALKFVRDIHDMMINKLYEQPTKEEGSFSVNAMMGIITLEKNGEALDLFAGEVSTDRITAIQEAYWSMASALSEADGIDYTDPEELELVVTTLIDLDAMDGKSSVSLLAECSSSPDVNTRKALANALAAAPSMWTLGNAGMGALQRLAQDSNPAVAAAATKTINELKKQWELEEGDSLRFMMNQCSEENGGGTDTKSNN